MSLFYLAIKLYPLFGLALAVLCFDLTRSFRRKGHNIWMGYAFLTILFVVTVALWLIYRGDLHSDRWYTDFAKSLRS